MAVITRFRYDHLAFNKMAERAMALEGSGCNVDDRSSSGCKDRRVYCTGWAQAENANLGAARREARDEAKRQKDFAIAQAESTIDCPSDGCDAGEVCRRRGNWFGGQQAGSRVDNEEQDVNRIWHVHHVMYVERRLRCACVSTGSAARQEQQEQQEHYPEEEYFF